MCSTPYKATTLTQGGDGRFVGMRNRLSNVIGLYLLILPKLLAYIVMNNSILSFVYRVLVKPFILNAIPSEDEWDIFAGMSCNKSYDYSSERIINRNKDSVRCTVPMKLQLKAVRKVESNNPEKPLPIVILFMNDPNSPYSKEAKYAIDVNNVDGKANTSWTLDAALAAFGCDEIKEVKAGLMTLSAMAGKASAWVVVDEPMDPSWNPSFSFVKNKEADENDLADAIEQDNEWLGSDENGDKAAEQNEDSSPDGLDDDVPF
jgi:hypothetical protein